MMSHRTQGTSAASQQSLRMGVTQPGLPAVSPYELASLNNWGYRRRIEQSLAVRLVELSRHASAIGPASLDGVRESVVGRSQDFQATAQIIDVRPPILHCLRYTCPSPPEAHNLQLREVCARRAGHVIVRLGHRVCSQT